MSSVYGTATYGAGVYDNPIVVRATYGTGTYGASSYNATLRLFGTPSRFGVESLIRNFVNDLNVVRYVKFSSASRVEAIAESALDARYKLEVIFAPIKLSSLIEFKAESIIDAEDMTKNFLLVAGVIRDESSEEDFNTGPVLGFDETSASLVEITNVGMAAAYQTVFDPEAFSTQVKRNDSDKDGGSTSVLLTSDGLRILHGVSNSSDVTLGYIFTVEREAFSLFNASIYGPTSKDRRLVYRPFNAPVLLSGINANSTQDQILTVDRQGRVVEMVELSIRVANNSTNVTQVTVSDSSMSHNAGMGFSIFLPAGNNTITKRCRVAMTTGKLKLLLSQKCHTIEIRVLGTWG